VNSYFHICGRSYYHDRVDVALAASTTDVDDEPVVLYLGYYDWGPSHLVVCVLNSDSLPFEDILYMAYVACDTYFV
jgi:hypothetical protein